MPHARLLFPVMMLCAIAIAACGGRGANTVPPSGATPTPTPHVGATTVPVGESGAAILLGDGSGKTAAFTLPGIANGASANMTIAMSADLPSDVVVPSSKHGTTHAAPSSVGGRLPAPITKPHLAGANFASIEYITVAMDGTVGISAAPSVRFDLGSTSIGPSQQTYLLLWDPYLSGQQGWIVLLGPGAVTGSPSDVVTFTGVPTAQTYYGGAQYVYALVTTSSAVPTATPAPGSVLPQATTRPAYCAGFATASPDPQLGTAGQPVPLIFNDQSRLNGDVVLYVTDTGQDVNGHPAATGAAVYDRALNKQGQWATPNPFPQKGGPLGPIQPIPLKCFPGSLGYTGPVFKIPVAVSGLLFIAYAPTPAPGAGSPAPPDPFKGAVGFVWSPGTPSYGVQDPSIQYLAGFAGAFVPTPWDVIEYCTFTTACEMDTTQENRIGLPLEVTQGGNTVGFGSNAYQNILTAFQNRPTYDVLPTWIDWGSTTILARIIAPGSAGAYGFPQDWWYNSNNYMYQNSRASALDKGNQYYYSGANLHGDQGYIGYLLQTYKSTPQLYTISGTSATTDDSYCATSDGASVFTFTEVAALPTGDPCAATPSPAPVANGNVFNMSAQTLIEGNPTGTTTYGFCNGSIFNMAAAGPADLLLPANEYGNSDFYLWKAMVVDIARGMAAQSVPHPYSLWGTGSGTQLPHPSFSSYWKDPVYDEWAYILHEYMYDNKAYALQYDELGGMSTSFSPDISGKTQLTITVQQIPTGGRPATVPTPPASVPWPTPPPERCPTAP